MQVLILFFNYNFYLLFYFVKLNLYLYLYLELLLWLGHWGLSPWPRHGHTNGFVIEMASYDQVTVSWIHQSFPRRRSIWKYFFFFKYVLDLPMITSLNTWLILQGKNRNEFTLTIVKYEIYNGGSLPIFKEFTPIIK
jgi:hypothetical protein